MLRSKVIWSKVPGKMVVLPCRWVRCHGVHRLIIGLCRKSFLMVGPTPDKRDERRFLIFCYVRCTLVGQGETKVVLREVLMKRDCFLKEQLIRDQVKVVQVS